MQLLLRKFTAFAEKESLLSRTFLVGGAVRDLLMAKELEDIDIVIEGDSLAVAKRFAQEVNGTSVLLDADFGIVRVVAEREHLDLCAMRGDSISADLADRDLTINAMAVSLPDVEQLRSHVAGVPEGVDTPVHLIDPFHGLRDLRYRTIRMVSEDNLTKDPLRLLRIYRFAVTLGFSVDIVTASAAKAHAPRVSVVAAERILEELKRILSAAPSYRTIRDMEKAGLLFHLFPELGSASDEERQTVFRTYDYLEHILNNLHLYFPGEAELLKRYFEYPFRAPGLKLASLLPGDGAAAAAERLRMSRAEAEYMQTIVANRDGVIALQQRGAAEKARFFSRMGDSLYALLVFTVASHFICQCADHPVLALCRQTLSSYHREFLTRKSLLPLITGDDLIRVFALTPSPLFRTLLSHVDELVLSGALTSREEALEEVRSLLDRKAV